MATLESIAAQVSAVAAQVSTVTAQIGTLATQLGELSETMDRQFTAVDRRFVSVDQRFAAVDQRFTSVDQQFAYVEQWFTALDARIDTSAAETRAQLRVQIEAVDENVKRVYDEVIAQRQNDAANQRAHAGFKKRLEHHDLRILALEHPKPPKP